MSIVSGMLNIGSADLGNQHSHADVSDRLIMTLLDPPLRHSLYLVTYVVIVK